MKNIRLIGLIVTALFLIALTVGPVVGENISTLTSDSGTTYINWTWTKDGIPPNNLTTVAVWIDGEFVTNSTLNSYTLSGCTYREKHRISLINCTNASNILATNESMTLYPYALYYFIMLLSIMFLLLELTIRVKIIALMFGISCFTFSVTSSYLSFIYFLAPFMYITAGISIFSMIWMVGMTLVALSNRGEF